MVETQIYVPEPVSMEQLLSCGCVFPHIAHLGYVQRHIGFIGAHRNDILNMDLEEKNGRRE
jgi:hypothetical protein